VQLGKATVNTKALTILSIVLSLGNNEDLVDHILTKELVHRKELQIPVNISWAIFLEIQLPLGACV
jgi:hypothetical protein